MIKKKINIVIDFDGTVVTHDFPMVGKDIGAIPVLKKIIENGHNLILFTMRSDNHSKANPPEKEYLKDAVKWFIHNDIPLHGVQTNPSQKHWTNSPKAYGDLIIDDASLGCPLKYNPDFHEKPYVDWVKVKELLIKQGII